ncbi:MAG: MraY family glycosyltransferase [bacterium]
MTLLIYIVSFGITFCISMCLTPLSIRFARRLDIQDHPGKRKIHTNATPLLGGLAIYISFIAAVGGGLIFLQLFGKSGFVIEHFHLLYKQLPRLHSVLPKLVYILGGATLISIVGLIDDIKKGVEFSAKIKLVFQILAAIIAVYGGVRTSFLPTDWLNILISIVWIVGICNAFNFLDNMDGLSCGIAGIIGVFFFAVSASQGQFFSALIFLVMSGSVFGFLRYNIAPARIFMGDTGSLFIGYLFGTLAITTSYVIPESSSLVPIVFPIVVLSVPLYDTFSVMIIRILQHKPIYRGDKQHLSHRLVDVGMSQSQAVVLIYLICICVGIGATFLPTASFIGSLAILAQTMLIYIVVTWLLNSNKRRKH